MSGSDDTTDLHAPELALGRYQLLGRIAAGGMAEVWKARAVGASSFEKIFAIKRLLPASHEDPEVHTMFIQEAKLVAELTHPNIVHVFDFGETERGHYLAMEYVPGHDLGRVLEAGRLPLEVALMITIEACRALGHAHGRQVVHRDVSPRNILLTEDGGIKVTDFGIAKVVTAMASTVPGVVKGKPPYMSPEQVRGYPPDPRSDLFSLGVVLYEMAVGSRLHDGRPMEVCVELMAYEGPPEAVLSTLPVELAAILRRVLARDAENRYESALELEAELMEVVEARHLVLARSTLASIVRSIDPAPEELAESIARSSPTLFRSEHPSGASDSPATPRKGGTAPVVVSTATGEIGWRTETAPVSPAFEPPVPPIETPPRRARWRRFAWALVGVALFVGAGWQILRFQSQVPAAASTTILPAPEQAVASATHAPDRASPAAEERSSLRNVTPRLSGTARPKATARPVTALPPSGSGSFTVFAKPWVSVEIDGVIVGDTPLREIPVAAGRRTLRVRWQDGEDRFEEVRRVTVEDGQHLQFFVDVPARQLSLR